MNVNELRSALSNIQISFKEVKEQIAFSNAEVIFAPESLCPEWPEDEIIESVLYEDKLVKLKSTKREVRE